MILRLMLTLVVFAWIEISVMSLVYQGLQKLVHNDTAFLINLFAIGSMSLWGLKRLRRQGASAMEAMQNASRRGQSPSDALTDQFLMLVGAILLVIPGYVSGVVGVSLLIPRLRQLYKKRFANVIKGWQQKEGGAFRVVFRQQGPFGGAGRTQQGRAAQRDDVIDVQAEDLELNKKPDEPSIEGSKRP